MDSCCEMDLQSISACVWNPQHLSQKKHWELPASPRNQNWWLETTGLIRYPTIFMTKKWTICSKYPRLFCFKKEKILYENQEKEGLQREDWIVIHCKHYKHKSGPYAMIIQMKSAETSLPQIMECDSRLTWDDWNQLGLRIPIQFPVNEKSRSSRDFK